ncbi:rRNA maturation RNase YbeY [Allohahella marinimesophila]|uniref:Endoribonuclease YbeY n=1 Tax=Allohahella marinimesophila TaxID=1054972 RepID=A0ABP7PNY3_9GAMM
MKPLIDLGFEDLRAAPTAGALPEFVNADGLLPVVAAVLAGDRTADETAREWSLSIQLLSPEDMQSYNSQYRGKDKSTNVLSFPFEPPQGLPPEALAAAQAELGDIFICPSVLEQEALDQGKTLDHHWMHIVIHGVLHLLGHDHIEAEEAGVMEAVEIALLREFGVADPYLSADADEQSKPFD